MCIVAVVLIILLKQSKPEFALFISIALTAIILIMLARRISSIMSVLNYFGERAQIEDHFLKLIFKVVGIAYIAEFGSELCNDAGEGAIASKIALASKVIIFTLSLPILVALLDTISSITS